MENFIMVLLADIMRMKCVVAKDPFVGTQIRILECQDLPAGGRNAKTERKRANRGARNFNVLAVVRRYPRGTCVFTTYASISFPIIFAYVTGVVRTPRCLAAIQVPQSAPFFFLPILIFYGIFLLFAVAAIAVLSSIPYLKQSRKSCTTRLATESETRCSVWIPDKSSSLCESIHWQYTLKLFFFCFLCPSCKETQQTNLIFLTCLA